MKKSNLLLILLSVGFILVGAYGFKKARPDMPTNLTGAWVQKSGGNENVLLFADGYVTQTVYNKPNKNFIYTRGGTFTDSSNSFTVLYEFDTEDKNMVGKATRVKYEIINNELKMTVGDHTQSWRRFDSGQAPLAGLWHITHRMENNTLNPIHQTGARKTVKILTGSRFQWAAINPKTKEFSGTGGGTYTFQNGKYTEHIEFFSRDSSRVGAALSFDDKLEGGAWHHTGLSSRGDKIYEVWGRVQ